MLNRSYGPHETIQFGACMKKHVLVCTGSKCSSGGSADIADHLKQIVTDAGKKEDFRVTKTSCLGRCKTGPTLVIYPEGVWYRGMTVGDAGSVYQRHLLRDEVLLTHIDHTPL